MARSAGGDILALLKMASRSRRRSYLVPPRLLHDCNSLHWPARRESQVLSQLLDCLSGLQDVWSMEQTDDCICYCSRQGCHIIACALSQQGCRHPLCRPRAHLSYFCQVLRPYFFALVDHSWSTTWMSSAILRILTFEELTMTHTYCYQIFKEVRGRFSRPTPDEAKIIHKMEQTDIDLLDDLMTEFEAAWAGYTKTFAKSIKQVWKPRMRVVRKRDKSTRSSMARNYSDWASLLKRRTKKIANQILRWGRICRTRTRAQTAKVLDIAQRMMGTRLTMQTMMLRTIP